VAPLRCGSRRSTLAAGWYWFLAAWLLALVGCDNSPYPSGEPATNTAYTAFSERSPRHLDPVASYWNQDTPYTYSIYEPPYGYHYLKRPFMLQPKLAEAVVEPVYLDKDGRRLPADTPGEQVAESVYELRIKPGVLYQPHPAFAKDGQGRYRYHSDHPLQPGELGARRSPLAFEHQGTRELVAEDFVYGLKRHATTRVTTPISGIFSEYIVGLKDYMALVKREDARLRAGLDPASLDKPFLDFRRWPLAGVTAPEKHLLRIRIHGKYPQWKYWMAMPFTAPMPWEAEAFYAQPGMARNGLSIDRWPVGTGPYMLVEFEQDRRHVLQRNPNFRVDTYPCKGMPGDREAGQLDDCGRRLPFIDRYVFQVEKEATSMKSKFRQGFLDTPEIERSDRGLDFIVEAEDSEEVRRDHAAKGFQLPKMPDLTNWFIGFNMLDPVVGQGSTPEQQARNRKLRQALSIALDWEEWSRVFPKKSGATAMSPLPPGMFGSRQGTLEGVNPVTHRVVNGKVLRRSLAEAKQLLAEAGYPDGRDAVSGRPLVLNYDFYQVLTPSLKAECEWVVKQFAKLGIQLELRATDNNQFQDKVRKGKHQIFWSGWLADYPDAENFLFLLYGPNGKTRADGENTANYGVEAFDVKFQRLKFLDEGPAKQQLIDEMVSLVQQDAPWMFGYIPWGSGAFQPWLHNARVPILVKDHLKYYRLDPALRAVRQREWNEPTLWPVGVGAVALALFGWLGWRAWRQRELATGRAAAAPHRGEA
jgi:ABC-type transport system substrate-binding protein